MEVYFLDWFTWLRNLNDKKDAKSFKNHQYEGVPKKEKSIWTKTVASIYFLKNIIICSIEKLLGIPEILENVNDFWRILYVFHPFNYQLQETLYIAG